MKHTCSPEAFYSMNDTPSMNEIDQLMQQYRMNDERTSNVHSMLQACYTHAGLCKCGR
jgi:hypothetical protein